MADERKPQDELQEDTHDTEERVEELSDEELDKVAGGSMLSDAVNNVIKSIGEGLSSAARKQ
jgi:bacteriocin-like protein